MPKNHFLISLKNPLFFLPEEAASDKILRDDRDEGEEKPDHDKAQADLSHEVKGKIAVIPDVHVKPDVYDQPAEKLRRGNDHAPDRHLRGEGENLPEKAVETADPDEAKPARDKHGRVGMGAVKDLDRAVNKAPEKKNDKLLEQLGKKRILFFH